MKKRFAFIPMVLAFVCALALSACGGASAEDLIRADLENYFGDSDTAAEQFAEGLESSAGDELDQLGISEDEFTEAYLEGFSYEIGDISVDGDTATVKLTLTIKSMGDIMTTFQSEFTDWAYGLDASTAQSMTEDDLYKQGGQMLLDVTKKTAPVENTYDVVYKRNSDGDWEMDSDSETELMNSIIS